MARKPRRGAEIARIMVWSGLTNLALLSVFLAAQSSDARLLLRQQAELLGFQFPAALSDEPVKSSLNLSQHFQAETDRTRLDAKGPLRVTMVAEASAVGPFSEETDASATSDLNSTVQLSSRVTTEETLGLRAAPILRKNPASGKLEIGNFEPLALSGDSEECVNMGYSMLGDVNSSADLLDIMVASDEITISRICTANGSVMITCRNGQISVSPRRSRPDDQCPRGS